MLALILAPCAAADEPMVTAITASRTIPPGVRIEAANVDLVEVPHADIAASAAGLSLGDVVGRVTTARLLEREPIRPERLADAQVSPGPSALLSPGETSIRLAPTGPWPTMTPGDHLDLVRIDPAGPCLLVEDVTVIAAERAGTPPVTDETAHGPFVAWHLAASSEAAAALLDVRVDDLAPLLRSRIDRTPVDPSVARCPPR